MQKLLSLITLSLFFFTISFAQNNLKPVAQNVVDLKSSGASFVETNVFDQSVRPIDGNADLLKEISQGTLLNFDRSMVSAALSKNASTISLTIPNGQLDPFQLELYQSDIIGTEFKVVGSDSGIIGYQTHGISYHGIVKGDDESVVAISIFPDEVRGIISNKNGNYVLGKLKGRNTEKTHVLYNDRDMQLPLGDLCSADAEHFVPHAPAVPQGMSSDVGDCVEIYFEADYDVYQASNSNATTVTNFINGFFNEVAVLYANESLEIGLSEIFIWQSASPSYNSGDPPTHLNDFASQTPSFNGNLAHLLKLENNGGIAWLNVLCSSNFYRRAYSGVGTTYQAVPTYSWTVNVVAHELGHNFGSNHTQACVWNSNNTQIDDCGNLYADNTNQGIEGAACYDDNNPILPGSGTIMSYCHLFNSIGVNFNNGFGQQPGDRIRARVAAANCLPANCSAGTSCTDGVQNGAETGVDCGGNCAPCPCNGIPVTLTIVFDNYPEEISWEITNAAGATVASASYAVGFSQGATQVEIPCLQAGCYDFTINDTYGDGLCCNEGPGSYTLTDPSGAVLASGGNFNSTETTNFCISNGCPVNRNLTIAENNKTETYDASDFISSTSAISNSDITYEAGNYIDLKPGFRTTNSDFLAHIVPCTPLTDDGSGNLNLIIDQNENGLVAFGLFLPTQEKVSITILNALGEEVFNYFEEQELAAGGQMINLDKRNFKQGMHTLKLTTTNETKVISWEN